MPRTTAWGARLIPTTTTTTPTQPHRQQELLELHHQRALLEAPCLMRMRRQETSKRGMMTRDHHQGAMPRYDNGEEC